MRCVRVREWEVNPKKFHEYAWKGKQYLLTTVFLSLLYYYIIDIYEVCACQGVGGSS